MKKNELGEIILPAMIETEDSKATLSLPNPSLLTYYKNLENRVFWMDCTIDEDIFEVSRNIIDINRQDKDIPIEQRRPIKLMIYSYGGDGQACFSLLDTILLSKTPVYTINMGVAMSAGLILLLSGVKRFCVKRSTALIHSGSGGTSGTYEQTEAQMKDYQRFVKEMREFILERTKIDNKLLTKNKNKEWYIYAADQKELGIVDEIIEDIDILL